MLYGVTFTCRPQPKLQLNLYKPLKKYFMFNAHATENKIITPIFLLF